MDLPYLVICDLLRFSILNKFSNLKMSSSIIKKVNLAWLYLLVLELVLSYKFLDIDVQLCSGLLTPLFHVTEAFIFALSIGWWLLKTLGKGIKYLFWVILFVHLFLQGFVKKSMLSTFTSSIVCAMLKDSFNIYWRNSRLLVCPQHVSLSLATYQVE